MAQTKARENPSDSGPDPSEPVAVVGISAVYPSAQSTEDYWDLIRETPPQCACEGPGFPEDPLRNHRGKRVPDGSCAGSGLDGLDVDPARFGIPPAQARSMARMQILMLEAARRCMEDAGRTDRALPDERTDVVVGTCLGFDRHYANALRVEGVRYADELVRGCAAAGREPAGQMVQEARGALLRHFGGSAHDRVGEMASTIPARIATAFGLHGRAVVCEAADATSFVVLAHAITCLRDGGSDAALVVTGQRRESGFLPHALRTKGLLDPCSSPFSARGRGFAPGEGVGALLLKRLSSALRDGDRVYATIRSCVLRQDARPGPFRRTASVEHWEETLRAAYRAASIPADSVQYLECAGCGAAHETEAEVAGAGGVLGRSAGRPVVVGSARDRLGHTLANAGLASVSKVALALYHRTLPPYWSHGRTPEIDFRGTPFRVPRRAEEWPADDRGTPRRAAVNGSSVTGVLCHLVMEEHRRDETRPVAPSSLPPRRKRTAGGAEPIAVLAHGGYFAGAADADAFWRTTLSGRDGIGPAPEALLNRELYHAPGKLSLTHTYTDRVAPVAVPTAPPPGLDIDPRRYAELDGAQRTVLAVAGELFSRYDTSALGGPGLIAVGSNLSLRRERRANSALAVEEVESAVAGLPFLADLPEDERKALREKVREDFAALDGLWSPTLLDSSLASGGAALVAHEFGLEAVPLAVEAACASSLAALDVAIGALRRNAVDYAVAGGVELPCNVLDLVLCSSLRLLSHDRIRPFDAAADGFTPGDGCALFLLKRYADARRAGDRILGVIRGIGASSDARSLIAPDAAGQSTAMRRAFEQVDFAPEAVDYLEAHGTGTELGDRTEIAAVTEVYAAPGRRPLAIGSAKSFFGHTFAAAGSAGLLRALHAVRTATLPPNAGLRTVNPALDLAAIPATVSCEASPWPAVPGRPRRAAVSSFGTGGINYHLLVEEHREER
ncbi:beta-ketoacyl synthase N-terminal-like domain-containing protein [Streptomyces sp. TRM76323]|uniref:Beta-ketoacyl synthase N-terminal-like domain-containing protein n=1 Tax=Streptomyces tamarix TaxID=3078565 RepID=A0ABU3QJB5_9ACTN|nr:beta-ketoacyl synthase N-terminal-like domain-containing protein [Streptomyces tamarix]MDT9682816.1 beta-ketoacyl synthase N-terminal-like domain-containing protein [Streptomyces tamarix]